MSILPIQFHHISSPGLLPGLILSGSITAVALWLGSEPMIASMGFGALTLAILAGMIMGNTLYPKIESWCGNGVLFAKQSLLRLGIILYGFRLTFSQIAEVGFSGLLIDAMTLCSTFALACWLGKNIFGLDRQTRWLIGAGSSICGAAAILATEPVVKADSSKVTVAVATVVIFGTLAIFIYPVLYPLVMQGFTPETFGVYAGSTMHEVAQVVAAGHAISPETENSAVITKMLRVMMLAPFLIFLSLRVKKLSAGGKVQPGKVTIPWFALLFIVIAIFNSFNLLPASAVKALIFVDTLLLAMAMAALGLTTHISTLKNAGARPLLLALVLFIWLLVGGAGINLATHYLIG
ncbi:YeiH family putative sulfate export transporter [Citrobacter sp. JGM124]|uniref:YeiH family putative sulfate export transporter n=1 Tax=Citrobacter sp. JGM124 TaxID=2799789 RepID=UPI001BAB0C1F|nr:YeiH family putative sulfate export transporter [Citrobacter sp. JGM124]MBS0846880.1 YeiH family putative sulfate export transporter [Citrobacter sp. JGM124]